MQQIEVVVEQKWLAEFGTFQLCIFSCFFSVKKIYIFFLDIYQKRSISSNNNLDNCIARARQNYLEKSIHNFLFFWLILSYLRQYSFFLVVVVGKKENTVAIIISFGVQGQLGANTSFRLTRGMIRLDIMIHLLKSNPSYMQSAMCTYFLSNQHQTEIKICGKIPQRNMSQVQFALEIEIF